MDCFGHVDSYSNPELIIVPEFVFSTQDINMLNSSLIRAAY